MSPAANPTARHVLGALAVAIPSLLLALPAGAATIGFAPSDQVVALGESVAVDLVISELGGEIVSAYDLDVLYDATVLRAVDVAFGLGLGDAEAFEVIDGFDLAPDGRVDLAQVSLLGDTSLLALQGGDAVRVATIVFETVAPGTTSLDFFFDAVNDVKGANAAVLPIGWAAGSVRVDRGGAPIPEPAAALLFAIGLAGVGWGQRGTGASPSRRRPTTWFGCGTRAPQPEHDAHSSPAPGMALADRSSAPW